MTQASYEVRLDPNARGRVRRVNDPGVKCVVAIFDCAAVVIARCSDNADLISPVLSWSLSRPHASARINRTRCIIVLSCASRAPRKRTHVRT